MIVAFKQAEQVAVLVFYQGSLFSVFLHAGMMEETSLPCRSCLLNRRGPAGPAISSKAGNLNPFRRHMLEREGRWGSQTALSLIVAVTTI